MTTNREWLDYLAQNAPHALAAWFDAEHVEHQERALDGDTEPQSEDSRERLEVEIKSYSAFDMMDTITLDMVIGWLDLQAAITEEKTRYKRVTASAEEIAVWRSKAEKLKEQVYELTAECDNLKDELNDERGEMNRQINIMREVIRDFRNERDHYRSKFGKCIDYADAIHALMDDEGMA